MKPSTCFLSHLENPNLRDSNLGLQITRTDLTVKPDFLPCCGGESRMFDELRQSIRQCQLKRRLKSTKRLVAHYNKRWEDSLGEISLPDSLDATSLQNVAAVLKGNSSQAKVLSGTCNKIGSPWSIAMALVWRFNQTVQFITFQNNRPHSFLFNQTNEEQPQCIIVEQVDGLVNPSIKAEVEGTISVAYQTNSLLWLEFVKRETPRADTFMARAYQHRNKINQLRNRHYTLDLNPDSASKLTSLTRWPRSHFSSDSIPQ